MIEKHVWYDYRFRRFEVLVRYVGEGVHTMTTTAKTLKEGWKIANRCYRMWKKSPPTIRPFVEM